MRLVIYASKGTKCLIMINPDNTTIQFLHAAFREKQHRADIKMYEAWLKERNIKYSFVRYPQWISYPTGINMRNEDALMFKLAFGL